MIMFEITYRWGQVTYKNRSNVIDTIMDITMDPEISIDVGNWCEIAKVGESYTGREFNVKAIEKEG